MIVIILVSVVAFWYGLRVVFKTENPLLAVASGSMRPTLEVGDLILIQGVQNACEIHAASKDANPPGDIIVFRKTVYPYDLIVHRAVEKDNEDGTCSITTQGDANPSPDREKVRESNLVGKYTGVKIPLLGYIALFFEPFEVKVAFILLWIILLVILEFVPLSRRQTKEEQPSS
jgi:signal peptidase